MQLDDDKYLFSQIARGDETAFTIIFNKYANPLLAHALKMVRREFWAEEVVQDVFAGLWASKETLVNVKYPSAYLYKMVYNRSLDRMRRDELEIKMLYFESRRLIESPDETAEHREKMLQMENVFEEALRLLPEQRRLVYQLRYQERLSYLEIADRLSITTHTVRNQISKALKTIRLYALKKRNLFLILLSFGDRL